jgi:hypothetical protein
MNDQLTQAARNTMKGGADVTLNLFYTFEGEDPGRGIWPAGSTSTRGGAY